MLKRKFHPLHIVGITAIIVGIGLRSCFYFQNDSFWRDESKLLLNIIGKSFVSLAGHLDYGQQAPVLFLWAHRTIFLTGGKSELSMRAIAFCASIVALIIYYLLARRCLPIHDWRSMILSSWIFAVSHNLILFSSQVKQYSLDLLVATYLLYLAYPILTQKEQSHNIIYLTIVSALAIWLSYPALFIVGGIAFALLLMKQRYSRLAMIVFLVIVISSFALEFLIVFSRQQPTPYWQNFWKNHFAQLNLKWCLEAMLQPFGGVMEGMALLPGLIFLFLCTLGLIKVVFKDGLVWVVALISPLLLALGASALHFYPFVGRFLIFAVPVLLLLIGYGLTTIPTSVRGNVFFAIMSILLIVPIVVPSIRTFCRSYSGVREALQFVHQHEEPGDILLSDLFAASTVKCYQQLGSAYVSPEGSNVKSVFEWEDEANTAGMPSIEDIIASLPNEPRIWLLAEAKGYVRGPKEEMRPQFYKAIELLEQDRACLLSFRTDLAAVTCFSPVKRKRETEDRGLKR